MGFGYFRLVQDYQEFLFEQINYARTYQRIISCGMGCRQAIVFAEQNNNNVHMWILGLDFLASPTLHLSSIELIKHTADSMQILFFGNFLIAPNEEFGQRMVLLQKSIQSFIKPHSCFNRHCTSHP